MPKIRFINLPRPLWQHIILERVAERAIDLDDLQRLRSWVGNRTAGAGKVTGTRIWFLRALWHGKIPGGLGRPDRQPYGGTFLITIPFVLQNGAAATDDLTRRLQSLTLR